MMYGSHSHYEDNRDDHRIWIESWDEDFIHPEIVSPDPNCQCGLCQMIDYLSVYDALDGVMNDLRRLLTLTPRDYYSLGFRYHSWIDYWGEGDENLQVWIW